MLQTRFTPTGHGHKVSACVTNVWGLGLWRGDCGTGSPVPREALEFIGPSAYLASVLICGTTAMATTNPIQFIQQVRSEVAKVVWPTRREVVLTTVMVFIMAALTATFFSLVDLAIRFGLTFVLNAFH